MTIAAYLGVLIVAGLVIYALGHLPRERDR